MFSSWSDNKAEGARGGFGLTAEPHVTVETLTPGIISSITLCNMVVYFVLLLWALPSPQPILDIGLHGDFLNLLAIDDNHKYCQLKLQNPSEMQKL